MPTYDPYSHPEKFDLSIVCEINDPDASYSFDMFVLWRHADGRLFWATDSGCSCPSPFEEFFSINDLTQLTDDSWSSFEAALSDWCSFYRGAVADAVQALRTRMMSTAAMYLRGGIQ